MLNFTHAVLRTAKERPGPSFAPTRPSVTMLDNQLIYFTLRLVDLM